MLRAAHRDPATIDRAAHRDPACRARREPKRKKKRRRASALSRVAMPAPRAERRRVAVEAKGEVDALRALEAVAKAPPKQTRRKNGD